MSSGRGHESGAARKVADSARDSGTRSLVHYESISRRSLLKLGAALPMALHSLNLHANEPQPAKNPPRRIIFICNSI